MSGVNHRLLQEVGGAVFWPLASRPALCEWMGSTGARWRTVTQTHPGVLCALCSSSSALCILSRQQFVFPALSKAFEILSTTHLSRSSLWTSGQPSANLGKTWVNKPEGGLCRALPSPTPTPTPQLADSFSSSRCTERSRPAAPARFASVSTHKTSIHATQGYNCATPSRPPNPTRCSWGGSAPTRDL